MAVGYALDLEARRRKELAATMQVRIGPYRDRVARGTVTSMIDQKPVPFCGLDQMLLLIGGLMDHGGAGGWKQVPDGRQGCWNPPGSYIDSGPKLPGSHPDTMQEARDFPQSFRIRVYGREHHSLQGELRMGNKSACFRSGMELMQLIHQGLGQHHGQARQREPSAFQETKRICIYKKREESER